MVTPRTLRDAERVRPARCQHLPLVYEAETGQTRREDLAVFLEGQRERLRRELAAHGALLFRGYDLPDAESFTAMLHTLGYDPQKDNPLETSPRRQVGKTVFTSTETPPDYPILAHNENSYLNERPAMISFFCLVEPEKYGETPVFDCRAAAEALPAELRDRLKARKVRYRRRLPRQRRPWAPNFVRTWEEAFGTEDREAIEAMTRARGLTCHWHANGRLLFTENVVDPLPLHPGTGEVCLNIQPFHKTSVLMDLDEVRPRQPFLRNAALKLGSRFLFDSGAMPMHILYGDGSPIPPAEMRELHRALWDHVVLFSWRKGDLLVLDNTRAAHGRMNVVGQRKILTAFADPVKFPV